MSITVFHQRKAEPVVVLAAFLLWLCMGAGCGGSGGSPDGAVDGAADGQVDGADQGDGGDGAGGDALGDGADGEGWDGDAGGDGLDGGDGPVDGGDGSTEEVPPERCNGLDDDFDGLTDEDFPSLGQACDGPDSDRCEHGVYTCAADGSGEVCGDEDPADLVEVCNGLDDDCDGALPAWEQDSDSDGLADCLDPILGYACDRGLDGRPLGGGDGYGLWVDPNGPTAVVVVDKAGLLQALASAGAGDVVYVDDGAVIDLGSERDAEILIPAGVTLASGRGRSGSLGALLFTDQHDRLTYSARALFAVTGPRVRVTGLRLAGPDTTIGETAQSPMATALRTAFPVAGRDWEVEIDNCEFYGWPDSAVSVYRTDAAVIHHNDFHHNRRAGFGYGVVVNYAFPTIGANVFDYNRHAIAATGYPGTSYQACHNLVLTHANSTSFDMHGGFDKGFYPDAAGTTVLIHANTFLAAGVDGIGIRGVPEDRGLFTDNEFVHSPAHSGFPSAMWQRFWPATPGCLGTGACVLVPWDGHPGYEWMQDKDACRAACSPSTKRRDPATFDSLTASGNTYGIAHKTAWFASFGGETYWSFRRFASIAPADLLFGDFDGDGAADGFRASGGSWRIYPGLRGGAQTINSSSAPQADLGVADFNGDAVDDVFYADGASWRVSWSGTSAFAHLNTSGLRRSSLHLADFDGDGQADVFRSSGSGWQVSWSGTSSWQALNDRAEPIADLRFGDLDGDGTCDVFYADGAHWNVSWSGTSAYEAINTSGVTGVALADLDGDGRADVFRANGATWSVSWAGRSAWQTLQELPEGLAVLGFADVNGDGRADVVSLR